MYEAINDSDYSTKIASDKEGSTKRQVQLIRL